MAIVITLYLLLAAPFGSTPWQLQVFTNITDLAANAAPANVYKVVLVGNMSGGNFYFATNTVSGTNTTTRIASALQPTWSWELISSTSLTNYQTPLTFTNGVTNVSGVVSADLTAGSNITFSTNSGKITITGTSVGTVGTVINSGTPVATALPEYSDTTGTNITPSNVTVSALTNLNAGVLNATNDIRLNGTSIFPIGTAGTVINTGTPAVGNVPTYTDTTGTNIAPSSAFTITGTNVALTGNLTADGGAFTNTLTLNGSTVLTTATAPGVANPTATIGLSAVNGSAASAIRSDGAPALPSTAAYDGAILVPWILTNGTIALQWHKPPQVFEFNGQNIAEFATFTANSGTATFVTQSQDTQEQGVGSLSTASLTNGTAGIRGATTSMTFTTNAWAVKWHFKTPSALSSATDGYEIYVGSGDSTGNAEPVDGAYFYYLHSVSNGVWTAKTSSNSNRTFASGASSTVTVAANTWYTAKVEGNSTVVNFWISADDEATWTWVGFSSGNIPSSTTRQFGLQSFIRKVGPDPGGTTAETMYIGRCEFWANRQN